MGTDLSSEIKTRFADAGIPTIAGRNAHVIGVEGVTERGPFGARLVTSWAEYKRVYGGFTANADVAKTIWAYFAECGGGSKQLYINRIVHRVLGVAQSKAATVTLNTGGAGTFLADTLQIDGKTQGAYANAIKIRILDATNGNAEYFNLQVELSGVVIETWKNLTMGSTSDRYVETIINHATAGSDYIAVTDLEPPGMTPILARPANGLSGFMTLGDDGLVGLADSDYTGNKAGQYGIYAFDTVQVLDLLIIPARATSAVQNAAVTYCESDRDGKCFFIADPPASYTRDQIVTYVETTAALLGLTQKAAMYWPRVRISNPDTAIFGNGLTITVSPSGHLAGLCARVAGETVKGKFTQPAGKSYPLYSVVGFEGEDDNRLQPHAVCEKATRDVVFPKRINPIRKDVVGPYYVDGEYTLKAGSGQDFPTVGEQLGAQYVAKEVDQALDVVRHMDNDDVTREQCRATADAFLRVLTQNGCFKSKDPALAYTVDFGEGLNTPDIVKQYKLKGYIGLATNDPILFGDIGISKDTRAYDASVAG